MEFPPRWGEHCLGCLQIRKHFFFLYEDWKLKPITCCLVFMDDIVCNNLLKCLTLLLLTNLLNPSFHSFLCRYWYQYPQSTWASGLFRLQMLLLFLCQLVLRLIFPLSIYDIPLALTILDISLQVTLSHLSFCHPLLSYWLQLLLTETPTFELGLGKSSSGLGWAGR